MPDGEPKLPADEGQGRRLALHTGAAALGLFVLVVAGAMVYRPQLEGLGRWFVGRYGVAGAAVGTLLADSVGFPIPPDVYLVAAVLGGAPPVSLLLLVSLASVAGGSLAFGLGRGVQRWPWMARRIAWFRGKGDRVFQRWGWAAVAIAAWTPVPFSVICTLAGVFRMPYGRFLLSTLHRVPRMVVYYYLIVLGWTLGGSRF